MSVLVKLLTIVALVCMITNASAATQVKGVRLWQAPDSTRLVFDLSERVDHNLFSIANPNRIVIDLKNTTLVTSLSSLDPSGSMLKGIRHAKRNAHDLRVVLDLKKSVQPKSFVLWPNKEYGHRLVIDLYDKAHAKKRKSPKTHQPKRDHPRDVIIAIDAGHGGEDPGALGYRGSKEKNIVLKVAIKLARKINQQRGMKAILVRKSDYFVSLGKRVEIARQARADLFISLHADSFRSKQARGSSVYVLSDNGASSEAAGWLADKENNSDLIGGVSLGDKDDLLKLVLVDMVKNSTLEDSHRVAKQVLRGLKKVNKLHNSHVEKAGFRVLRAPDMPSILIEMAYITNPSEERRLRSGKYQSKMSVAILNGVNQYFKTNAPPGTILAIKDRKHKVSSGETLSQIAKRYRVSISWLRNRNKISGDILKVGNILQIPAI